MKNCTGNVASTACSVVSHDQHRTITCDPTTAVIISLSFPPTPPCNHTHSKLAGRTLFITGASRGIGKAIALRAAQDGANIVIAAKTAEPHPKLPGTIFTAAKEGGYF